MTGLTTIQDVPKGLVLDSAFKQRITAFLESISQQPEKQEIKLHPYLKTEKTIGGEKKYMPVEYVPIEIVESKLDYFFLGLWQTRFFKYSVIVNELVGDIELSIFHPEAGIWLTRSGAGGVMIQQRARNDQGEKMENDYLDINRKIANTLGKDMGHLKAECIKNAAKSFGRQFGRDLSRDIENVSMGDVIITEDNVEKEIMHIQSPEELALYVETLPMNTRNDKRVRDMIRIKRLELKSRKA